MLAHRLCKWGKQRSEWGAVLLLPNQGIGRICVPVCSYKIVITKEKNLHYNIYVLVYMFVA